LWVNTFVNELKASGYGTILYGNKSIFKDNTSDNFGSIPLWHAQYLNEPEISNPTVSPGWQKKGEQGWSIWQFSSQGRVNGYGKDVDLNAMKVDFFNKYA